MFYSLDRLSSRLKELQTNKSGNIEPIITFDKDDVDTLDFVAASANLRSVIFGIESKSKFDIKRTSYSVYNTEGMTNRCRNGWKHYSSDCHNKRHDRRTLCFASIQSFEG